MNFISLTSVIITLVSDSEVGYFIYILLLEQLVGPQLRFKMQKVVWDSTEVSLCHYSMDFINSCPIDSPYPLLMKSAAAALEEARGWMSWGKKDRWHRCRAFFAYRYLTWGGQTKPMVLHQYFPIPHIIHMDSTGFCWILLDFTTYCTIITIFTNLNWTGVQTCH
ncbi:uncharacterized protein LACBIDRAFT_308573 [Laccaria bicolor S238N-H82]|uniref:Predicted protein n=1 Tax=Laccaria bicolor (strain S238N-H82 / ATCC MYA-4686) TaxID=486041 RepID=B0CWP6_LACBS|nr:uncharacterized protein LACBIDRAFT_308573 [Laccaria bicolor S238N-H82]EDR13547.1 predicted protein [Laccaria bicolor S238N-H82]|eukprot:XP_001876045.1 predicted protein [Laccaria bicolor S238N-H82]